MNKITLAFLLCGSVVLSIHSEKPQNTQLSGFEEVETSPKKSRRLSRKKESAAPLFKKEEETIIKTLDVSCPQKMFNPIDQPTQHEKTLCLFLKKVEFTKSGMFTFFSQIFNRREYGTEFLPHNFGHLTQFMKYGHKTKQGHDFFDGVIRLFNTKLKATSCVNSAAFESMLDSTTPFLAHLFEEKPSLWKDIKKLLWTSFKDRFAFLQEKPMDFFEDVSDQILKEVKAQVTTPEKLRTTTVRFLSGGVDKLAWCPEDQQETWSSFKTLGTQLTTLHEKNIIEDPLDLNELYWGLIERYCYFLELAGPALSLDMCLSMKQDITSGALQWLKTQEQEAGLETKAERLMMAIIETEAKIRLFKMSSSREFSPQNIHIRS